MQSSLLSTLRPEFLADWIEAWLNERRVWLVPILCLRIIDSKLEPDFVACFAQLLNDVTFEWRVIDDIVIADRRIEEREAVVMLAGDDDIFHPRILGDLHPLGGAELGWVAGFGQLGVFLNGDFF